jgi:hypothetical protein
LVSLFQWGALAFSRFILTGASALQMPSDSAQSAHDFAFRHHDVRLQLNPVWLLTKSRKSRRRSNFP